MGKVRDIIDKTFEYGQGRGELPGVNELGEAIRILSDSENPQSSQDDLSDFEYLRRKAYDLAHQSFGNRIYIRGLIEFTNICKNDCYYCGIRKSNSHVDRYRLTMDQILVKSGLTTIGNVHPLVNMDCFSNSKFCFDTLFGL